MKNPLELLLEILLAILFIGIGIILATTQTGWFFALGIILSITPLGVIIIRIMNK